MKDLAHFMLFVLNIMTFGIFLSLYFPLQGYPLLAKIAYIIIFLIIQMPYLYQSMVMVFNGRPPRRALTILAMLTLLINVVGIIALA